MRALAVAVMALWLALRAAGGVSVGHVEEGTLRLPAVGSQEAVLIAPGVVEWTRIGTKPRGAAPDAWDFVGSDGKLHLPPPQAFAVTANGSPLAVRRVGFRRRVGYAPLRVRDLRLGSHLILELASPVPDGARVRVRWGAQEIAAAADARRYSAAVHVNEVGYLPGQPKAVRVGYYLGSLGELRVPEGSPFQVLDAAGRAVCHGTLVPRPDHGFAYGVTPYQRVLWGDFSALDTPGEYRVFVPGLGVSYRFRIDEGVAAAFARTYALGLYHQRCGAANVLPFTRFTHAPCHVAPAFIPTAAFAAVQSLLDKFTQDRDPSQTAPRLSGVDQSLYPFGRAGAVDAHGGHHDAGDYSKYTINSAQFIHYLIFAADNFPGAVDLDNLGLPESGDGKSDLLQIAKWEADFLARLQDDDGGFYFMVYPRGRKYESDVLPDRGDAQVVYPKTTAVTAAAVAALAQAASSPAFRRQFPTEAALYLKKARLGWDFLARAFARHGRQGAYQKITHYGEVFGDVDEVAWATVEMYLATGDAAIHRALLRGYDPAGRPAIRWGWMRMFESYGCAWRDYAFAVRSGRVAAAALDGSFLRRCEEQVRLAADDHRLWAAASAYGVSFPIPSKRFRTAGWFFPVSEAFDLAAGYVLTGRREYLAAYLENLDYEAGANPLNVPFVTGLGWRRQREIVHQFAQNDRRAVPPSGIPIGAVQAGFAWVPQYGTELRELSFPSDGDRENPYPMYDRWADAFNVTTEFVAVNQARALAGLALFMARTPLARQPWRAAAGSIRGVPAQVSVGRPLDATLSTSVDLAQARVVWEGSGIEPTMGGATFRCVPARRGPGWLEAEAQLPDGRRVFGAAEFTVR